MKDPCCNLHECCYLPCLSGGHGRVKIDQTSSTGNNHQFATINVVIGNFMYPYLRPCGRCPVGLKRIGTFAFIFITFISFSCLVSRMLSLKYINQIFFITLYYNLPCGTVCHSIPSFYAGQLVSSCLHS